MEKLLTIALCALFAIHAAEARTLYVNAKRPNNKGSGLSRAKAKKTLQAAINIAKTGDVILVLPGSYAPIKTRNRKIRISGLRGPAKTKIVKPAGTDQKVALALLGKTYKVSLGSDGRTARSGVWTRGAKTVLQGFALDGKHRAVGSFGELVGVSGGTVRKCVIRNLGRRFADTFGGYDTYENAAAAVNSYLLDCRISGNCGYLAPAETAAANGETTGSTFQRCKIFDNRTWGGIEHGTLRNCLLYGNVVNGWAGLFERSDLLNCTVADNLVEQGDSTEVLLAYKSRFKNCISFTNYYRPSWQKTIGYHYYCGGFYLGYRAANQTSFEVPDDDTPDAGTATVTEETLDNYWPGWTREAYKATAPAGNKKVALKLSWKRNTLVMTDSGSQYPAFVNKYTNDYHLSKSSPFIDAGELTTAQKRSIGGKDLDGKARIKGKAIDRGCYEY